MTPAADTYDLCEEMSSLNSLIEGYHGWFLNVLSRALYPDEHESSDQSPIPSLFVETLVTMSGSDMEAREADRLRELNALHHRLEDLGKELVSASGQDARSVEYRKYSEFTGLFKVFISGLQKTCQNLILEEWGLDILTGLKNSRVMEKELAQEMERLARQGRAFALALARIDDFAQIESLGRKEADRYIKRVALFIGRSLRSFDSAYRLDRQHFVMVLKQADIIGGRKALVRLSDQLESAGIYYEHEGEKRFLTMSCCIAEPVADDSIPKLLEDLRRDLDTQRKEQGAVLTYHEMSPLQRFVQSEGRGE